MTGHYTDTDTVTLDFDSNDSIMVKMGKNHKSMVKTIEGKNMVKNG